MGRARGHAGMRVWGEGERERWGVLAAMLARLASFCAAAIAWAICLCASSTARLLAARTTSYMIAASTLALMRRAWPLAQLGEAASVPPRADGAMLTESPG